MNYEALLAKIISELSGGILYPFWELHRGLINIQLFYFKLYNFGFLMKNS